MEKICYSRAEFTEMINLIQEDQEQKSGWKSDVFAIVKRNNNGN